MDVDPDKSTIDKLSSFFGVTEAKLRELTEIYSELAPAAQEAVVNREFAELPIEIRAAMLQSIKKSPAHKGEGLDPKTKEILEFIDSASYEELDQVFRFVSYLISQRGEKNGNSAF